METRLRLEVFFGVVLGPWKCGALSSSRSLISKLPFRIRTNAAECFRGSGDLDKLLEVDALNAIFPFMTDTREQKD